MFVKAYRLGNFSKGHYKEHFCEIILNLYQWFRGDFVLRYFYLELTRPFCYAGQNR